MNLSDLEILKKHFDARIDGYFVFAKNKDQNSLQKYVVGWYSRHQENELASYKAFTDASSAHQYFKEQLDNETAPRNAVFNKDFQDNDVYSWEEKYVEPQALTITPKQAKAMIKKVCDDYDIPEVMLKWKKMQGASYYIEEDNKIEFGHRDNISLLHELAHAIHAHDTDNGANHNPSFVWIAIELYHRYAGLDLGYLITTAIQSGLLGDVNTQKINRRDGYHKDGPILGAPRL